MQENRDTRVAGEDIAQYRLGAKHLISLKLKHPYDR